LTEILFKQESYQIIAACLEVHKVLGNGFKEIVYKDAMEYEFKRLSIPYDRERKFKIFYKDILLRPTFIADFVIDESIVLEIKATPYIGNPFIYQTINYLKASNLKLGIVINFGESSLKFKRVVF